MLSRAAGGRCYSCARREIHFCNSILCICASAGHFNIVAAGNFNEYDTCFSDDCMYMSDMLHKA